MLEKTPESPLDSKKIKPVNLKGNQPWILIGKTNTEVPVFWSPDVNCQLIEKFPDTGKDWGQKEKRASEDEMAGWLHRFNGHKLGQTLGDGEGQGDLAYCSPWGRKESYMTGGLNNNKFPTCFKIYLFLPLIHVYCFCHLLHQYIFLLWTSLYLLWIDYFTTFDFNFLINYIKVWPTTFTVFSCTLESFSYIILISLVFVFPPVWKSHLRFLVKMP